MSDDDSVPFDLLYAAMDDLREEIQRLLKATAEADVKVKEAIQNFEEAEKKVAVRGCHFSRCRSQRSSVEVKEALKKLLSAQSERKEQDAKVQEIYKSLIELIMTLQHELNEILANTRT